MGRLGLLENIAPPCSINIGSVHGGLINRTVATCIAGMRRKATSRTSIHFFRERLDFRFFAFGAGIFVRSFQCEEIYVSGKQERRKRIRIKYSEELSYTSRGGLKMKIFVAGGTGAIGRPLIGKLIAEGHAVVALTRSLEKAQALMKQG